MPNTAIDEIMDHPEMIVVINFVIAHDVSDLELWLAFGLGGHSQVIPSIILD